MLMTIEKLRYTYHLGIRLNDQDIEVLNQLVANSGLTKSIYARKILRDAMKKELRKNPLK